MNEKELLRIVNKGENHKVEFKSKLEDGLGKSICSFANTNDGIVLIGIGDDGKIVGIDKKHEREIANIAHTCKPSIYPKVEAMEIEGKNIFVVTIKKLDSLHSFKNIAYKRIASHNKPLSPEEFIEFAKSSGKIRWDEEICKESDLKDVNWKFIKENFILLYENLSEKKVVGDEKELLGSLGCIKKNKPTNAGILLFGKEPQKFFVNSYIALARYKGKKEGIERLDYKEFTGNIIQQIDNCNEYIKENIAVMSRLLPYKIQRQDVPEYGFFSIRELITNAVCHRDYENQHTKVIIKMFSDRIEFYNPGGLPKKITPKNITEKQFSRNPVVARVLAKIKYIEELGEGWNKIIEEHKKHLLKPRLPKIKSDACTTTVTIFSTKEKFEKKEVGIDLSERQKKIMQFIGKNGRITTSSCASLLGISADTALRELTKMKSLNLIKTKGVGKGIYYVIK